MSVIKTYKVEVFMDHLLCDDCGAEMKYTHDVTTYRDNTRYKHKCPKCGYSEYFDEVYPRIIEKESVD